MLSNETCERASSWAATALDLQGLALLLISVLGCLVNALQLCLVPRVRLWPINIQFFLVCVGLSALVTDIMGVVRYFVYYRPYLDRLAETGPLQMPLDSCKLLESFYAYMVTPLAYFLPAIAVERWLVITNRVQLTDARPNAWVVVTMVGVWLISFSSPALTALSEHPPHTCFCALLVLSHPGFFAGACGLFFLQEMVFVAVFRYVIRLNRAKFEDFTLETIRHSLAERFQLKMTVELTEMLLPSVVLQAVIWCFGALVTLVLVLSGQASSLLHSFSALPAFGVMSTVFGFTLHATLHPLILFYRSEALRKKLRQLLGRDNEVSPELLPLQNVDSDQSMEILQSFWDRNRPKATNGTNTTTSC